MISNSYRSNTNMNLDYSEIEKNILNYSINSVHALFSKKINKFNRDLRLGKGVTSRNLNHNFMRNLQLTQNNRLNSDRNLQTCKKCLSNNGRIKKNYFKIIKIPQLSDEILNNRNFATNKTSPNLMWFDKYFSEIFQKINIDLKNLITTLNILTIKKLKPNELNENNSNVINNIQDTTLGINQDINHNESILFEYFMNSHVRESINGFCSFIFKNGFHIIKTSIINNINTKYFETQYNDSLRKQDNKNNNFDYIQLKKDQILRKESPKKRKKKGRKIVNCIHKDKEHYAKNKCFNCYLKTGRSKKAWLCKHKNKSHYAKGVCHECYIAKYNERKKINTISHNEEFDLSAYFEKFPDDS